MSLKVINAAHNLQRLPRHLYDHPKSIKYNYMGALYIMEKKNNSEDDDDGEDDDDDDDDNDDEADDNDDDDVIISIESGFVAQVKFI